MLLYFLAVMSAAALAPEANVRAADGPIVVDGRLDDEAWGAAEPIDGFVRYQPTPGGAHGSTTEVRVLQDADTLYFGVKVSGCTQQPVARIAPREDINNDDQIGIYLDPFNDGNSGYIFYFNAIGVQQDIRFAYGTWYSAWNTVVQSEGRVTDDGYVLEVAIPFRSLSFPRVRGGSGQVTQDWGVMVTRKIPGEGAKYSWPAMVPRHPRLFSQAGVLVGVQPPSTGAGVELMPVLAMQHAMGREDETAPLTWLGPEQPIREQVKPGMDLRVALTPDIGAAVTLNPDFSQVEGDIRQINLNQRFAINYREQRPFFLAGVEAYGDELGTLVTRSIVEPLYGAKVSGRQGGLSLGVLQSLDLRPGPSTHEVGTPGFSADDIAGRNATNSFLRVRQDVVQNGYVGFSLADKRLIQAADLWTPSPDRGGPTVPPPSTGGFSDVAMVDSQLPLAQHWTIRGHVAGSVAGDADEQLQGALAGGTLARTPPLGTGVTASAGWVQDEFRNELGFATLGGHHSFSGGLTQTMGFAGGASTWAPGVYGSLREEDDGGGASEVGVSQDLQLGGNHGVSVTGGFVRFSEAGQTSGGPAAGVAYEGRVNDWLGLFGSVDGGRVLDYAELVSASRVGTSLESTLRIGGRTRFETFYASEWYAVDGAGYDRADRLYSRLNVQLDRFWGLRLVGSRLDSTVVDQDRTVYGSVLLTWLKSPGTEAYVGATWSSSPTRDQLDDQVVFAKVSRLFRL